jgi:hypothetical protein
MLIGWFGNQWFMDFNSFSQIELYLEKRILDWRFYILGHGAWGMGHGAWEMREMREQGRQGEK